MPRELSRRSWRADDFWFGRSAPETAPRLDIDVGLSRGRDLDDRGVMIIAGTRGGKGVSLIVPNLVTWPGDLFCIDVKGELASHTAVPRGSEADARGSGSEVNRFIGQNVAVLDPFGEVKGPARVFARGYNPLLDLDPNHPGFVAEVRRIARALVIDDGDKPHFPESVRILIAGLIELIVKKAALKDRNLAVVRDIMVKGRSEENLARLPEGELVKEALGALRKVGRNEAGSFHTTLTRQWAWLADPRMQASVRDASGFSLARHMREGGSTYVSVPFEQIDEQARWLRLMLTAALSAKLRQGTLETRPRQTLFVIDEMPALGPLDMIEKGVAYLSGYGVKPVTVVQNLSQLVKLYEQNWQTFIGNTGAVAAFALMDDHTPEFIAKRLGGYEFVREVRSTSHTRNEPEWTGPGGLFGPTKAARDYEARRGGSTQTSVNPQHVRESVLYPEDVRLLTSREQMRMIVVPADGWPMFLSRVPYWERFGVGHGWYESRENIARVEGHLGKLSGLLK